MKTLTRLSAVALTITFAFAASDAMAGKPGGKYRGSSTQSQTYQSQNYIQQHNPKLRLQTQTTQQFSGQYNSGQFTTQNNQFQGGQYTTQSYQPTLQTQPKIRKYQDHTQSTPKLGFNSQFGNYYGQTGEYVTQVNYGSTADKLGLKPGQVILAVNGQGLKTKQCWDNHMQHVQNNDGWVTLKVRDTRNGKVTYQTANLMQR